MIGFNHYDSCVSSITSYCGWRLGSARNFTEIASSRSTSFVETSFANASVFKFLLRGMTSMEVAENKLNYSFALSK